MTRQIRWLGPENCEEVFAALGWEHSDEELDHSELRGLGESRDQTARWGDLLVQDEPTAPWRIATHIEIRQQRGDHDD